MKNFGCVNNTIKLNSGKYFDLANPSPEDFTFGDIAGALSKICRFGGQCKNFYSVAEHSWHCQQQADRDGLPLETQQAVLLHDAAEAFVGDVVKPLKIMLMGYHTIEYRVEKAIGEKFNIDFEREKEAVKKIDREMLIAERRRMFGGDSVKWTGEDEVRALSIDFRQWIPGTAEAYFVSAANAIGINVNA